MSLEPPDLTSVAMVGCGSMGGGIALLLAEGGVHVSLSDPKEETMERIVQRAEKAAYNGRIQKSKDYPSLCKSLSKPRLLIFSLPHGNTGNKVLEDLMPYLEKGDIIVDCGNEHYANTERRQEMCKGTGIQYIGCGVSGGYQAARAGPSICPGGDEGALKEVMPLLEKIAAKDKDGKPCVGIIGKGGAGHYVKMVHNGIEHGMMSVICEVWGIMRHIGMGYEEIGDVFNKWNGSGELQGTFLISIGADLSHKRETDNAAQKEEQPLVISEVLDKVVQDVTGEEGTGIWSNTEAIELHVPAFTLNVAHALRLASAYRGDRLKANETASGGFAPQEFIVRDKDAFVEDLRRATYSACLACYIQGMHVISRADQEHAWNINYANVWKIWRAGCIIQADYISDEILKPILLKPSISPCDIHLLYHKHVAEDIRRTYPSLRRIVSKAVESDQVTPALSASLEYFKVVTGTNLPTSFYEAELDYFGAHMFDKKGEQGTEGPTEGKYHFEWKPVKTHSQQYGRASKI